MPDGFSFEVKPAVRENTAAFVALAGPSGSGKTRSALELATGLAGDGKILVADTEGKRSLHYADMYTFDRVGWTPPFTPESNAALIDLAEKRRSTTKGADARKQSLNRWAGSRFARSAFCTRYSHLSCSTRRSPACRSR
jgi:KaiC/GvpD/RAD55 family RecA-like ATPase